MESSKLLIVWGGIEDTFIAKEKGNGSGVFHFLKGYVTFTSILDLSAFDGPTWGTVSSGQCEKF